MKPRTRIKVLESAPPQYRGLKGWAMSQQGPYWNVTFETGGEGLLHRSEFEEVVDAPAAAAKPVGLTQLEAAERYDDVRDVLRAELRRRLSGDTEGGATD